MDDDAVAVQQFLVRDLGIDSQGKEISPATDLLAGDLLDSMGITQTVVFLEERFGVEVEPEDLVPENFRSIDAMLAFVGGKEG
jgi:acyl carrier protein